MSPSTATLPISRRVMNLAHFLTQSARRFPDHTALVWGAESWSWRDLDARVTGLAAALAAAGIGKGDRVLVH
ncbi:MAG: acyl-CoA synthetase, partial [Acetobacteraceae bacterium]